MTSVQGPLVRLILSRSARTRCQRLIRLILKVASYIFIYIYTYMYTYKWLEPKTLNLNLRDSDLRTSKQGYVGIYGMQR